MQFFLKLSYRKMGSSAFALLLVLLLPALFAARNEIATQAQPLVLIGATV